MFADIQIKVIICHLCILFGRIIQKYIPSNSGWKESECTGKLLSSTYGTFITQSSSPPDSGKRKEEVKEENNCFKS